VARESIACVVSRRNPHSGVKAGAVLLVPETIDTDQTAGGADRFEWPEAGGRCHVAQESHPQGTRDYSRSGVLDANYSRT
jgi:hypothetical protein